MGVSASVTLQWDRGRCLAGNQRLRSDRSQHRGRGGWLTHLHLETLAIGLRAVRDSDRRRETTFEARVGSHHKARRRAVVNWKLTGADCDWALCSSAGLA